MIALFIGANVTGKYVPAEIATKDLTAAQNEGMRDIKRDTAGGKTATMPDTATSAESTEEDIKKWCEANPELGKYDYSVGIANKFADIAARAGVTPADPNVGRPWPPRPIIEAEVKKYPLLWAQWEKADKEQKEAEALQDKYRKNCR
jgi:hypothetical protein